MCEAGSQWICKAIDPFCPTPRPRLGSACQPEAASCRVADPDDFECGSLELACADGRWVLRMPYCPLSSRRYKEQIQYLGDKDLSALRDAIVRTRLATYRYRGQSDEHLGFIIEDQPNQSPAVLPSGERVDLYGYVSMTVAALQTQQKEIDDLKAELRRVREGCGKRR
jgi:hypothetical protein